MGGAPDLIVRFPLPPSNFYSGNFINAPLTLSVARITQGDTAVFFCYLEISSKIHCFKVICIHYVMIVLQCLCTITPDFDVNFLI